jgi:hypothetical protein
MKCNMGMADRWFRIIGGLFVIVMLGFVFSSWWVLIGVALLATGIFGVCPLYIPLKFNTLKKK